MQNTSICELIPSWDGEPGELIDLDDELIEDPTVAHLTGEDTNAQICGDASQKEEEENDVDTLIAMWNIFSLKSSKLMYNIFCNTLIIHI